MPDDMKRISFKIEDETARRLEEVAPARSRRRELRPGQSL
jgi:predicted transcriptional regulator